MITLAWNHGPSSIRAETFAWLTHDRRISHKAMIQLENSVSLPNTEPKPTPSVLKNRETEVQFSSGVGFGLGFRWNHTFSLL